METVNHCAHCGKQLYGRSDKRFCNDTCRNTFNRAQRQRAHTAGYDSFPEIFRIIRKNYEILKKHGPDPSLKYESSFFQHGTIEEIGIDSRFFTSIWQENDMLWRFCFDYGWCPLENEGWMICYRHKQLP